MRHQKVLEGILQDTMARWDIPGLAVGIVDGEEILYARGFGVQSLQTHASVTTSSVFCLQSVSKCFVATAVMQFVEQGKLALDAPLVQYLPYFQMADDRSRQITIRQVLSHTSGIPDIAESDYIAWIAHPEVDDGAAERFVRGLSASALVTNPGERFSYSNIGYNILGDLLAKVAGMPFESVIREHILEPAGMLHSSFLLADIPPDRLAWPHLRSPEMRVSPNYPYQRADAPSSFLHATIEDMCRWCITTLQRGRLSGQRILSSESYRLMWTPVATRGNPPSLYEEMGLGWVLGHYKGVRTVCHGGAGFGGTSFLLILPDYNCAVVVLCNEESNACYRIVQTIADLMIGEVPQSKTVSWVVPVSRALAEGGAEAAHACYVSLRDGDSSLYYLQEDDLDILALQLRMVNKLAMARDVLALNIAAFPGHIESYLEIAKCHIQYGENAQAKEILLKALAVEPTSSAAAALLEVLP